MQEVQQIAEVIKNCKESKADKADDCTESEATLVVINQNLESINNALQLEAIGALIGIFVTISTIVLPIFMMANMRAEKSDIKEELGKNKKDFDEKMQKLEESHEEFRSDMKKIKEEKSDIIEKAQEVANGRSLARNKIMLYVYQAKTQYFIDIMENTDDNQIALQDILETQARAHEIELNIIRLMSSSKEEVKLASKALRELLDSTDYEKSFMKHIRAAVIIINKTPDYNIYQWQQAEIRKLLEWLDNPDDPLPIIS